MEDYIADAGRDPADVRFSYQMFDPESRASGGAITYYASMNKFNDMAESLIEAGMTELGPYYPALEEQYPDFEKVGREAIPAIKARHAGSRGCPPGGSTGGFERYAFQGDAVHQPALALIVVDGLVPGAAVVPEGDGAVRPAEAAGVLRLGGVGVEELQERLALFLAPAVDADGEVRVDV